MQDGMGSINYEYSQLSQLMAETRSFNDYLPSAPLANNSFRLQYSYQLGGQMQSYTDAYGQQFNYGQDKAGRLQSVTGSSSFGGVTNYANNAAYRAWGGLKHLEYGANNAQINLTFNNRLQAASYAMTKGGTDWIKKSYSYLPTGEIGFSDDEMNITGIENSNFFDRLYRYDHQGRVTQSRTGEEARGGTDTDDHLPYRENFTYDAFGHTTSILGTIWESQYEPLYIPTYVNNRATDNRRYYDADGRELGGGGQWVRYDAAGRSVFSEGETVENTQFLDGGGAEVKRSRRTRADGTQNWSSPVVSYFIKSSALGGKLVNEVKSTGAKERAYVYGAGAVVALQGYDGANAEHVNWQHYDASGKTLRYTSGTSVINLPAELEASGNDVGTYAPLQQPTIDKSSPNENQAALALMDVGGCELDGVAIDCSQLGRMGNALAVNVTDDRGRIIDTAPVELILGRLWIPRFSARYHNGQVVWDGNQPLTRRDGFSVIDVREGLQNTLQSNQEKCDFRLARIFGDNDAVIATANEPTTLLRKDGSPDTAIAGDDRINTSGFPNPRESPLNGNAHLYALPSGYGKEDGYAYTPPGYQKNPGRYTGPNSKSSDEVQSNFSFVYLPGSLKQYGYDGGLRINFVHSGTTDSKGNLFPPDPSVKNEAGSIKVGVIGNYGQSFSTGGNSGGTFVHNHMLFNIVDKKGKMGARIDPRKVFCKDLGFK